MSDVPRETLSRIITRYGSAVCDNPKRCEALLRDLCGAYRREINILMGALEERVPAELLSSGKTMPRELLLARLSKRLQDQLAFTEDAAQWAVDSWALALGVASSKEVEARRRKGIQNRPPSVEHHNPTLPYNSPAGSAKYEPLQTLPLPKPPSPAATSIQSPPVPSRPGGQRVKARPQTRLPAIPPASPSPLVITSVARPPLPSTVEPARGGMRKLGGCLLAFLFIIGLGTLAVFVVPVVVELLRQEQVQPSINEPRVPVN